MDILLQQLYMYPSPMKQYWLKSMKQTNLKKIAGNVTPVSQVWRLLRNWLNPRRWYTVQQARMLRNQDIIVTSRIEETGHPIITNNNE